jgi:putative flavoprotein involved in K+ transport
VRQADVVVVGAGQAGLATSAHLSGRGIEHVVLERGRVAESWRTRRWDSFTLNAPNWAFQLPGYSYDGPNRDAFMLRDELVSEFAGYAQLINAPVEEGVEVIQVTRDDADGNYRLSTSGGDIRTRAVVAATGPYQRRHRPANSLDPSIAQLNTDEFRNAASLPDGGVLVVGSGQSGCQVAEDLREAGRDVWLATGTCAWIPRRYRGKDNVEWRWQMGMFDEPVEKLGTALRVACPPIQTGVGGGHDQNLTTMRAAGVTLLGRFLAGDRHTVALRDDLQSNAANGDAPAIALRARIDNFIADRGIDAPQAEPFEPAGDFSDGTTTLDLRALGINTVIWATGFRLDYSWIDLDLKLTPERYPEQQWGVSPHAGLYFMGLQLMNTRKSGLIFGVGEDAEHISAVIAEQLGAAQSAAMDGLRRDQRN